MAYSLTEAAKAVGRTRQAVQVAIKKGTISAKKDAFGHWTIDPAELHRVYSPVNDGGAKNSDYLRQADSEKESKIRELVAKVEGLERLVTEAQRDRDAWRNEAQDWKAQAKALPASTPQRGFWARLFGS